MMTRQDKATTRIATAKEVQRLISWAEKEGWNPGLDDSNLFFAADQSGFFVTLVNDTPIAGISIVKLNSEQAFLGLYLCQPEYRGKGYGMQTWQAALGSAGNRSIGLDGVVAQQENYVKEQFKFSHRNIRFAGSVAEANFEKAENSLTVIEAGEQHLNELVLFDTHVGGVQRRAFYEAWLNTCESRKTYAAISSDAIVGIIGVRECIEGYKVGPLLANDLTIAETLLDKALQQFGNSPFMIDVPEPNTAAMDLMHRLGFSPIFETARMYRGTCPHFNIPFLFGVATLELG